MFWQCERCFVSVCLFSSHSTQTFFFFDESIARFGGWIGFWWEPQHEDIRIDICITWIRTWSIISVEIMALKFLRCCHIRCVLTFPLVFSEFNTCAVLMKLATEKIYWPHFTDGNGNMLAMLVAQEWKVALYPDSCFLPLSAVFAGHLLLPCRGQLWALVYFTGTKKGN